MICSSILLPLSAPPESSECSMSFSFILLLLSEPSESSSNLAFLRSGSSELLGAMVKSVAQICFHRLSENSEQP